MPWKIVLYIDWVGLELCGFLFLGAQGRRRNQRKSRPLEELYGGLVRCGGWCESDQNYCFECEGCGGWDSCG